MHFCLCCFIEALSFAFETCCCRTSILSNRCITIDELEELRALLSLLVHLVQLLLKRTDSLLWFLAEGSWDGSDLIDLLGLAPEKAEIFGRNGLFKNEVACVFSLEENILFWLSEVGNTQRNEVHFHLAIHLFWRLWNRRLLGFFGVFFSQRLSFAV